MTEPEKKKPRSKTRKQLEDQLEKTKAREAKLKEQLAKKKAKERKDAKKWEDNAKIQIGGIVLKYLGLDWRTMDQEAFERNFAEVANKRYGSGENARPVFECRRAETLEPTEARNAWMDFQSKKQHEAAEARKARANEQKESQ